MRALLLLAACSGPAATVAPSNQAHRSELGYASVAPPDEAGFARALAAHDVPAIEQLLAQDLPAFEERARAIVPADHLAALDAAWIHAIARGAPMLMFAGTRGEQEILTARVMRVGAWVDDRFVPVGPPVKDAVGGWLDVAHGRAISVGIQVDDCKSDFCPKLTLVRVEAWSTTSPAKLLGRFERKTEETHGVVVESGGALRVQLNDCSVQGCRTPWENLTGAPDDGERIRLVVDHRGSQLTLPHPGLTMGDSRTYAADAKTAIVASTLDRCECQDDATHILRYELDRVDVRTGALTELARGNGQSAIVVGKGGVYLQRGNDRVERFASLAQVGAASGTALPPGFVLLPPAGARMCCGL